MTHRDFGQWHDLIMAAANAADLAAVFCRCSRVISSSVAAAAAEGGGGGAEAAPAGKLAALVLLELESAMVPNKYDFFSSASFYSASAAIILLWIKILASMMLRCRWQ